MTALTVPARREDDGIPRPVPWRRMAWVAWRQHRIALTGAAVFLGALAVGMWIAGLQVHRAYAVAAACHPASSLACSDLAKRLSNTDGFLANGSVLQAVPALIGALVGAPVLARELETGTFRYAWTQGFGRWRWTLAKLVMLAVVVAAAAGCLTVLFSWYYQPSFATRNQALALEQASPVAATMFDLRGIAFAAWTLAAFAIGALVGMLIRRVVPAIVATLTVYAGLAAGTGLYLRPHYLTPLITGIQNVPGSADMLRQWGTRDGRFVFAGQPPLTLVQQLCASPPPGARVDKLVTIAQCLSRHGYTWWTSYQPASRFWAFQWIEGGWLLALSALLIAATVWLVHRRAA